MKMWWVPSTASQVILLIALATLGLGVIVGYGLALLQLGRGFNW